MRGTRNTELCSQLKPRNECITSIFQKTVSVRKTRFIKLRNNLIILFINQVLICLFRQLALRLNTSNRFIQQPHTKHHCNTFGSAMREPHLKSKYLFYKISNFFDIFFLLCFFFCFFFPSHITYYLTQMFK